MSIAYRERRSHARGVYSTQETCGMGTARVKQEKEADARKIVKKEETDTRTIAKEEKSDKNNSKRVS